MISSGGVRYELDRMECDEASASYAATVTTVEGSGHARVHIDTTGARIEGTVEGISDAHTVQLLAIARTLARRAGEGWPRRIHRWRAPGVR